MKIHGTPILLFAVAAAFLVTGCTAQTGYANESGSMQKTGETMEAGKNMPDYNDTVVESESMADKAAMPGSGAKELAKNYYRYDTAAFKEAAAEGKVIFLYFRANWCPVCNSERPAILEGMGSLNYSDVAGFEVHYNDDESTGSDNEIISQYQVAYQHTKIIIGRNGRVVLKTLDVFDKERLASEIEKARSA